MGCGVYYRRGRSKAEPACRQVSRAKRSAKNKMCSSRLRCRSAAGSSASPCCGCPATACEACGLRRLWRSPRPRGAVTTTYKARRRQDGVRNGAERAQRIGADVGGVRGAQAERSGEAVVPQPSNLRRSAALCAVLLSAVRI
jgi:hypothetical protein